MRQSVILDSGPLVASLNRRDQFHKWAVLAMKNVQSPLFACEPVIVETCFLLKTPMAEEKQLCCWCSRFFTGVFD